VPAKNLRELMAYLKSTKSKVNFASSGSGTTGHLAGEMFKQRLGVELAHVPYKGDAPAFADLLGGHVQMMFATTVSAVPHIKAGKLVPIAIAGLERDATLPDLPTMTEAGLDGFDAAVWYGVVVRSGTPPDIVKRLNAEINAAMQVPEVKAKLIAVGAPPKAMSSEQFATMIRQQRESWGKIVRASGARVE